MKSYKLFLDLRQWIDISSIDIIALRWHICDKDIVLSAYFLGIGIVFQYTFKNNEHPI